MRECLLNLFSIDRRSLTAFRIGLALIIIWDLAIRSTDLTLFYTDAGVLPRFALLKYGGNPWEISLHLMSGLWEIQAALFLVQAVCAVGLLVGYRTRLMSVLSWFLMASLQSRNHMIIDGGDHYLRMLLFWSMFVPLGIGCSVDRALDPSPEPPPARILSWGTAGLLLQTVLVYWVTAGHKWKTPAWHDGSAVYYALTVDILAKPFANWLLLYPSFLSVLTHAVLWFEIIGPLLLFCPVFSGPVRTLTAFSFIAMHAAFYSCLSMEIFPRVSALAMLIFLPAWFWDHFAVIFKQKIDMIKWFFRRAFQTAIARLPRRHVSLYNQKATNLVAGISLGVILLWNSAMFFPIMLGLRSWVAPIVLSLHLDQHWMMFPDPAHGPRGWIVIPGRLKNGLQVDLLRNGKPLTWQKPKQFSSLFSNERRLEMIMNFTLNVDQPLWRYYADYLCRNWNESHAEAERLESMEIDFLGAMQPFPGEPKTYQRLLLLSHSCSEPADKVFIPATWFRALPALGSSRRFLACGEE